MYTYDIAVSFAGEDRTYVDGIVKRLKAKGLKVFYDRFEEANLLGKDLYQYFHYVYSECALFGAIFVSKNYIAKAWTKLELRAMQSRAFLENREYILPIYLESEVKLPGVPETIGYTGTWDHTPTQVAKILIEKVETVGSLRKRNLLKKERIYKTTFEIFNYIITRYTCFGGGSKAAEIGLLEYLVSTYKNFLLKYAQEINADLYDFLIHILEKLSEYMNSGCVSLYHSVELQYQAMALSLLQKAFRDSGFSETFDFYYYLNINDFEGKKSQMLDSALNRIVENIEDREKHPITATDYITQIVQLELFDEYDETVDNSQLVDDICRTPEIQELLRTYNESQTISFDADDTNGTASDEFGVGGEQE